MKELKEIYRKRKHQLLPLFFGFSAFFVFFRIVMPQWTDIGDTLLLLDQKKASIEAKTESLRVLNSVSDTDVENNYSLITTALPVEKDIILIFSELSNAAERAGVRLGGFSVKVGGIYASDGSSESGQSGGVEGIPFLNILVNVTGLAGNSKRFAEVLYESLPLVEIKSINIGKNDARYDVNFFYKPVTVRPNNADTTALKELTPQELKQLEDIRPWQSSGPIFQ